MGSIWRRKTGITLYGESHGSGVGAVIDGFPAGVFIDNEFISNEMKRRAPGQNDLVTSRKEEDLFIIQSGVINNRTTGAPISIFIENKNKRSKDYEKIKTKLRPGHSDFSAWLKYGGYQDYRGGGHFSARLTAALVCACSFYKMYLINKNIKITSHIYSIKDMKSRHFIESDFNKEGIKERYNDSFPSLDKSFKNSAKKLILDIKEKNDSVGGIVETAVIGCKGGFGDPFFDSVESRLSSLLFSIPAVKGVSFGCGFDISEKLGSEANDEYYLDKSVKTVTNNNGGVLGGITTGMPIVFQTAFKPTPSIAREQRTVDLDENKETTIKIEGRHDPCVVIRGIPVVEAVAALLIGDYYIEKEEKGWITD